MKCIINRRAQFSASHRYWLDELSNEENQEKFGPCTQTYGHGHNYELFISLFGEIDDKGMVLNLSDVKHVIKKEVTGQLDYSFLNHVWPEFQESLPTTENIARVIWHRLAHHLPLHKIQLFEHPELFAEYHGNDMEAYLTIGTHFSAAHRLAKSELTLAENTKIYGKCARVNGHGHNYHLEVTVKGEINPRTGMLVNLVDLQQLVDEKVVEPLDHTFLNKDIAYFVDTVPTAENIAVYIAQLIEKPIADLGAELFKVKLVESPNNSCEIFWGNNLKDTSVGQEIPVLATV
jgi:6-pyruvoyltetrahydropterin/6-carboxytetrahydropterin synthase